MLTSRSCGLPLTTSELHHSLGDNFLPFRCRRSDDSDCNTCTRPNYICVHMRFEKLTQTYGIPLSLYPLAWLPSQQTLQCKGTTDTGDNARWLKYFFSARSGGLLYNFLLLGNTAELPWVTCLFISINRKVSRGQHSKFGHCLRLGAVELGSVLLLLTKIAVRLSIFMRCDDTRLY